MDYKLNKSLIANPVVGSGVDNGNLVSTYAEDDPILSSAVGGGDVVSLQYAQWDLYDPYRQKSNVGMVDSKGDIVIKGVVDGLSGIIVGASYYPDYAVFGKISIRQGGNLKLGMGISSTELMFEPLSIRSPGRTRRSISPDEFMESLDKSNELEFKYEPYTNPNEVNLPPGYKIVKVDEADKKPQVKNGYRRKIKL